MTFWVRSEVFECCSCGVSDGVTCNILPQCYRFRRLVLIIHSDGPISFGVYTIYVCTCVYVHTYLYARHTYRYDNSKCRLSASVRESMASEILPSFKGA